RTGRAPASLAPMRFRVPLRLPITPTKLLASTRSSPAARSSAASATSIPSHNRSNRATRITKPSAKFSLAIPQRCSFKGHRLARSSTTKPGYKPTSSRQMHPDVDNAGIPPPSSQDQGFPPYQAYPRESEMRILVVGAGAIGGYFGGRLLAAGRDVTFLVRERRAAQLARTGIVIRSSLGDVNVASPPTVTAGKLQEPFDVILLSCKAYDLAGAIDAVAPAVGQQTAILPILNGMAHLDRLAERF